MRRKNSIRASRIKAWILTLALISTAVPVYGAEPEYEEVSISEDVASEDTVAEEALSEDMVPDEAGSEDAVADDAPTYQLQYDTLPDGTLMITGIASGYASGDLIIPEEIEGKKVTAIGNGAFELRDGFAGDLVLPEGLTAIGNSAFLNCSGFTGDLVLPKGLKTIEANAFFGCYGFTGDLVLPKGLTNIGIAAFFGCSGFTGNLVLPEGLTNIGTNAFFGCSGFTGNLILPEGLTTIGNAAFSGCSGFTGDLVLPKGLTTIEDNAFLGCSGFGGKLVLPKGLTTIESYAFYGCSGFTGDLVLPEGLTTIGDGAFYLCRGFTGDLVLPEGLTTIGDSAFYSCRGFTGDLVLPEGLTSIGTNAFSVCSGFTGNLVLPEGLTIIGGYAFYRCTGFDGKLVIPDSVTSIGANIFTDCWAFRTVTNRSAVVLPLHLVDSSSQDVTWTDAATGATITEIANGTAIRSDAYDLSNEDSFTHSIIGDAVYTGKKIVPDINVYHRMTELQKGKDYTITYKSNAAVGTASFTIKGKGKYYGSVTDTFNILEKSISENDVNISDIPMIRETGKTYTPVPTITYNKKKLKKGTDFTVKYYREGNLSVPVTPASAGKYIAHIEGINNFKETVDLEFEITPAAKIPVRNLTVAKIPAQKYTGGAIEPEVTVKNGKKILKAGEDFKILDYENNVLPGTAKVIIEGVRKRGYAGKRTVTFKIVGSSVTKAVIDGFVPSFTYDGTPKTQDALKLYKDKSKAEASKLKGISETEYEALGTDAKKSFDYTYSYAKNTDAGTAVMTITGVNSWTGKVKKVFTIKPYNIKTNEGGKVSITLETVSQPYTGAAIKPEPVVKYGERVLTKGSDYTLSYANNVAVNDGKGKKKPTIKITGKGNFSGTDTSTTFVITKPTMEAAHLAIVTGGSVSGNKKGNWKAKVDVITPNGKKLKQGKDYTVRYTMDEAGETPADPNAALPAGTNIYVHVTAKPGASYTGGLKSSYEIKKYDITKLTAVVSPKVYTGKALKIKDADITWKSGKKAIKDVAFEIDNASYLNNINPGKASVRVKGKDDYSGTKTVTFRIATRKILWWWV